MEKNQRKEKQPKELWAFWANHYGPFFQTAQKVKWDEELQSWWHEDGDSEIKKVGLYESDGGYMSFSSENKQEVENFIAGFMACRTLWKRFFE